jgi:hypothetical protein
MGHTSKFGIGKRLELIFTLETTALQVEVNSDFSNIKAYDFNNLEDCIERFNLYQKHGYNNMQIITRVNYKNEPIIEDVTACIEFSVNSQTTEQQETDNKRLAELEKSNYLHESFLIKMKAKKLFDKFIEESENEHKADENNSFWYEFTLRGFSPFCQPKGHIQVDNNKGKYGIIAYNRPLTDSELSEYELRPYKAS